MPDSKRFLHPEAIAQISPLELRARYIVEGFLSGSHRSPYFGQSVEFLQHREYAPGDDLRHIDWKVWGKQDKLYIKQYEAETNFRCHLLIDVSKSMSYGRGPLNKFEYGVTIAACLAYLVLQQHDAVGCVTFDDKLRAQIPCRSTQAHLRSILEVLNTHTLNDATSLYSCLRAVAEGRPKRGMMVLVSDLLGDVDGTMRGLRLLRQRGHDVLVFHLLDDDELDFPFNGPTRFDGLESDDFLNCNPRALRDGYLAALQEYLDKVRRQSASMGVDYMLVRTSDSFGAVLTTFLGRRLHSLTRA
jgi:uncharacterized protein (DUF58 family)